MTPVTGRWHKLSSNCRPTLKITSHQNYPFGFKLGCTWPTLRQYYNTCPGGQNLYQTSRGRGGPTMSDHCSQYNIYSEIPNWEPELNNDSNEIKCKRKVTVKLCYRIWWEAILGTHKSIEDVNYIHFLACGHKLSCYEQEAFCPVFSCKRRLYYFLSFLFLDWTKRKRWELEIFVQEQRTLEDRL